MKHNARTPGQIGAIIRRERRAQKLTQAQLGARIGRRQATISKLENGAPATQLDTLFDVLSALKLQLSVAGRGTRPDIESIF